VAHVTGHDRSQTLLLPESLDDYVGPDNSARFIDAFVDGLDLAAAGFAKSGATAPVRTKCGAPESVAFPACPSHYRDDRREIIALRRL
jgi:hypothetical protein